MLDRLQSRVLLVTVGVAACGRVNFDLFDPGDGGSDDGSTGVTCWPAWRSQTVRLTAPRQLTELGGVQHGDPAPSFDSLTLYYVEEVSDAEIHFATRPDRGSVWTPHGLISELSSPQIDVKLTLSADGLNGVFSSDRTMTNVELWHVTRASTSVAFETPTLSLTANLNTGFDDFDPHLSASGLHLYFAPGLGNGQEIRLGTRAAVGDAFVLDRTLVELAQPITYSDPSVSPDELVIVFAALTSGELFYASRGSTSVDFGAPVLVPDVDGGGRQTDVEITSDGCELYFSSTRTGPKQIFVSTVM